MLTLFTTAWKASGLNRYLPYLIVALIVTASLVLSYMQGQRAGKSDGSLKQATDSLNRLQREAKARAEIQSIDTSVARKQLRERWSSN